MIGSAVLADVQKASVLLLQSDDYDLDNERFIYNHTCIYVCLHICIHVYMLYVRILKNI
jgi:hypothetical protein